MRLPMVLLAVFLLPAAEEPTRLRPPLWKDADNHPGPKPKEQNVSELFGVLNNSWLRHLSLEEAALAARDRGALNVNAWDEVPDSTWFTNRIGRTPLTYDQLVRGIEGAPPAPDRWLVERNVEEGYTPKFRVKDSAGQRYWVKFDLPDALERNSGAERIGTLILHAAGYNVPFNSVVHFRAEDLVLAPDARFTDHLNRQRPMTPQDLADALGKLKKTRDGRYRALASHFIPNEPIGKFKFNGVRPDDPNDVIPHELRRELRGLRVIASWINHADAGDKNTHDVFIAVGEGRGYVKHCLLDFGSTLGSGNFVNGPYRVGHEYVFDGSATAKTFWSFGAWRRPWEAKGRIDYPQEVGYFSAGLFSPRDWKTNYPNLAFVRMDGGDAYWGARIVMSFPDELIRRMVQSAEYSRPEVAEYVATTLMRRRDAIVRYWLTEVSPPEDFAMSGRHLRFSDRAGRGLDMPPRQYRCWMTDPAGRQLASPRDCDGAGYQLERLPVSASKIDRFGRTVLAFVSIQAKKSPGKWAQPVEVAIGRERDSSELTVLGWRRGVR